MSQSLSKLKKIYCYDDEKLQQIRKRRLKNRSKRNREKRKRPA